MNSREALLNTVNALMAKAASTEFGPEAEAFLAKAEQLIERHAIEQAELRVAGDKSADTDSLTASRVSIIPKLLTSEALRNLLTTLARGNRCKTVWIYPSATVAVYGFETDVEATKMIYHTLATMMPKDCERAVRLQKPGRQAQVFRKNFYNGFVAGVYASIYAAQVERECTTTTGHELVLLKDTVARVNDFVSQEHPKLNSIKRNEHVYNHNAAQAGVRAGTAAHEAATRHPLDTPTRGALR